VHVVDDVLLDFLRHVQFEGGWVADVELEYSMTLFFESACFPQNYATDFITNVIQLGGFIVVLHKTRMSFF
jgi:hypothetical protein